MSFRYREPRPEDYDTQEEYEEAVALYESALDDYCDSYLERERDYQKFKASEAAVMRRRHEMRQDSFFIGYTSCSFLERLPQGLLFLRHINPLKYLLQMNPNFTFGGVTTEQFDEAIMTVCNYLNGIAATTITDEIHPAIIMCGLQGLMLHSAQRNFTKKLEEFHALLNDRQKGEPETSTHLK